jgi:hypothetical protein
MLGLDDERASCPELAAHLLLVLSRRLWQANGDARFCLQAAVRLSTVRLVATRRSSRKTLGV